MSSQFYLVIFAGQVLLSLLFVQNVAANDGILLLAKKLEKKKWDSISMVASCYSNQDCCYISICGKRKHHDEECILEQNSPYPLRFDRTEAGAVDAIIESKGYKQLMPFKSEFIEWVDPHCGTYHCEFKVQQNGYYQRL